MFAGISPPPSPTLRGTYSLCSWPASKQHRTCLSMYPGHWLNSVCVTWHFQQQSWAAGPQPSSKPLNCHRLPWFKCSVLRAYLAWCEENVVEIFGWWSCNVGIVKKSSMFVKPRCVGRHFRSRNPVTISTTSVVDWNCGTKNLCSWLAIFICYYYDYYDFFLFKTKCAK